MDDYYVAENFGDEAFSDSADATAIDELDIDIKIDGDVVPIVDADKLSGFVLPPNLSTPERLKHWYSQIPTEYIDLISQLGGSAGTFLIHAESLLIRFALEPSFRSDFSETPQFLRLIFYIERFLLSLSECGGSFRLVFFNNYKDLLKAHLSALWAVRQAFLLLCQTSKNNIEFVIFESWLDPQFALHIWQWQPPFLLMDDCADLPPLKADEDEDQSHIDKLSSYPLCLMLSCLSNSLHTACFFDLERRGRKVYSFVAAPHTAAHLNLNFEAQQIILKETEEEENEPVEAISSVIQKFVDANSGKMSSHLGLRDFLIAYFVKDNILVDSEDEDGELNRDRALFFGKMVLIVSQLSRIIPLEQRCFVDFEFETDENGDFLWEFNDILDGMCQYLIHTMGLILETWMEGHASRFDGVSESEGFHILKTLPYIEKDAADLFDQRLIKTLLILTLKVVEKTSGNWSLESEFFGISESVIQDLDTLSSSVIGLNKKFFPIDLKTLRDELCGTDTIKVKPLPKIEAPKLMPLQNQFVSKLLGSESAELPNTATDTFARAFEDKFWSLYGKEWGQGQVADVESSLTKASVRDQTDHLQVSEEKLARYNAAQRETVKRRYQLRYLQKGAHRVHKLATSLAGISEYHYAIVVNKLGTHTWYLDEKAQDAYLQKLLFPSATPAAAAAAAAAIENVETTSPESSTTTGKKTRKAAAPEKARIAEQKQKVMTSSAKGKLSAKAEDIVKKNEEAQKLKISKLDSEKLPILINTFTTIRNKASTPQTLLTKVLDQLVDVHRVTDELSGFKGVTKSLKLPESQVKLLMKAVEMVNHGLTKNFKRSYLIDEHILGLHKLLCFAFELVHHLYRLYKLYITSEDILALQHLLIALGFVDSAKCLFETWKEMKLAQWMKEAKTGEQLKLVKTKGKGGSSNNDAVSRFEAALKKMQLSLQSSYMNPSTVEQVPFAVKKGYETEVQLKFMGHQMQRTLGSMNDPRVKFQPDAWQVRLLDVIDQRRSALVCAPTGCGKTFMCYYAMEKVLSLDDESVVVFVCPSKALVHQVSIEVAARFRSKEYPPSCRIALTGIALKEFSESGLDCQVLTTLPEVFEMYLMSPSKNAWVNRIKYVILDEIHSIGSGNEEARAWERLVQLIPCPFLALSATVGNPGSFHHWLGKAHLSGSVRRHDDKAPVEYIQFDERYADLNTCIYSPDIMLSSNKFAPTLVAPALSDVESTAASSNNQQQQSIKVAGGLYSLNPFICLSYHRVKMEGIPADFYASSSCLLEVYFILKGLLDERLTKEHRKSLPSCIQREIDYFTISLQPSQYFVGTPCITKKQYRYYLHSVKASMVILVQGGAVTESLFTEMIHNLTLTKSLTSTGSLQDGVVWAPALGLEAKKELSLSASPHPELQSNLSLILSRTKVEDSYNNVDHLLHFCRQLNQLGLLPALVFNFNRQVVTHMCSKLVQALKKSQWNKYYGTPEAAAKTKALNRQRMDAYKAILKTRETLEKLKGLDKESAAAQGVTTADIESELAAPKPQMPIDIAEEYDDEFNFCDRRVFNQSSEEITKLIEDVRMSISGRDSTLNFCIEALSRGIGVHHSGLPRRYRVAVECLIRKGFLKVVFTTETLGLGINVPCKTTAFIGDSLQLTPLMYRQTSGRAGRRGFDTYGHIVFWEMPFSKLKQLISAKLPVLSGDFPVTPTLALRCLGLVETFNRSACLEMEQAEALSFMEQKRKKEAFTVHGQILVRSLQRLFRNPLFSVSTVNAIENAEESEKLNVAIQYALRFALDMLRRSNLLDDTAKCQKLAGLNTLLYESEPANNAINFLLSSGILHEYLREQTPKPDEVLDTDKARMRKHFQHSTFMLPLWKLRRLLTLLAFCLCRIKLSYNAVLRVQLGDKVNPFFPPIEKHLLEPIDALNQIALENAIGYIQALSTTYLQGGTTSRSKEVEVKEHKLPYSKIDFNIPEEDVPVSPLLTALEKMNFAFNSRSPFAAVCGRGDNDFKYAEELCHSTLQSVYLEISLVQQLKNRTVDINGTPTPMISNYLLDFFNYGRLGHTVVHSAVDKNTLWYQLEDFKALCAKMKEFVLRAMGLQMREVFGKCDDDFYKIIDSLFEFWNDILRSEAA